MPWVEKMTKPGGLKGRESFTSQALSSQQFRDPSGRNDGMSFSQGIGRPGRQARFQALSVEPARENGARRLAPQLFSFGVSGGGKEALLALGYHLTRPGKFPRLEPWPSLPGSSCFGGPEPRSARLRRRAPPPSCAMSKVWTVIASCGTFP